MAFAGGDEGVGEAGQDEVHESPVGEQGSGLEIRLGPGAGEDVHLAVDEGCGDVVRVEVADQAGG